MLRPTVVGPIIVANWGQAKSPCLPELGHKKSKKVIRRLLTQTIRLKTFEVVGGIKLSVHVVIRPFLRHGINVRNIVYLKGQARLSETNGHSSLLRIGIVEMHESLVNLVCEIVLVLGPILQQLSQGFDLGVSTSFRRFRHDGWILVLVGVRVIHRRRNLDFGGWLFTVVAVGVLVLVFSLHILPLFLPFPNLILTALIITTPEQPFADPLDFEKARWFLLMGMIRRGDQFTLLPFFHWRQ
mmetsp:Transcript_11789/g.32670  ORF Transcript_11789/g.32670 Transcript_11789/m.32670 type:complete len:241 (-) Transcript_11789:999-1721(-)